MSKLLATVAGDLVTIVITMVPSCMVGYLVLYVLGPIPAAVAAGTCIIITFAILRHLFPPDDSAGRSDSEMRW